MSVFFVHEPSRGIVTPLSDKFRIRQILAPEELDEIQKTHRKITSNPENYPQPSQRERINPDDDQPTEQQRESQLAANAYSATRDQPTDHMFQAFAWSIMSKPVITTPITSSLSDAIKLMQHHSINHLVIIDEKHQLAGLLSEKNILPYLIETEIPIKEITLDVFCRRTLLSATPDTDLYELAHVMLENRIDGIVIIENNTLQGIITYSDMVKVLLKAKQLETTA
ncbi:CBS domain-containing protein [Alkalimarinus alittae]|uniref:CBS domain-containing protein n=1 Tax=Alkalimarinus alittae TaxID=2961619 RepID=A0ABY6N224_9ALTE|nr:CBS domain-containing protein [Alkalimarinus alittae]UZE96049.1 CBS domain-containing protein [Alkalimarinus alittae]